MDIGRVGLWTALLDQHPTSRVRELAQEVEEAADRHAWEIGVEWTVRQVECLLEQGVPAVHLYVMQGAKAVSEVMRRLRR